RPSRAWMAPLPVQTQAWKAGPIGGDPVPATQPAWLIATGPGVPRLNWPRSLVMGTGDTPLLETCQMTASPTVKPEPPVGSEKPASFPVSLRAAATVSPP